MSVATNNFNSPIFDVVEYIKKLRSAGVSQEVAEIQGQEIEHVINNVLKQTKQESKELFDSKDLATKLDIKELEVKIKNAEIKLMALYGAGFLILLGVLAKGFHWL